MNNTTQHWTEDPTLLEQFVLGKVSQERMILLREHLTTCAACREAVERETEFIGTVRAYGRDRLRLRLKEKLERSTPSIVPWPHVVSAAAIVLFVVGLGIYNRWWQEPDIVQSEEQIAAGGKEIAPPVPEAAAKLEDSKITSKTENVTVPETGQSGRSDLSLKSQAGKAANEPEKKKQQVDEIAGEVEEPSLAARPRQKVAADELDAGKSLREEYWVDGMILDGISPKAQMRTQYGEKDSTAAGHMEMKARPSAAQKGNYVLQQMPGAALPLEQQRLQKGHASIPTKVSPTPDGAMFTVFTDIINLRKRTIQGQIAGNDSLIFIVDGLRIAYKLPSTAVK